MPNCWYAAIHVKRDVQAGLRGSLKVVICANALNSRFFNRSLAPSPSRKCAAGVLSCRCLCAQHSSRERSTLTESSRQMDRNERFYLPKLEPRGGRVARSAPDAASRSHSSPVKAAFSGRWLPREFLKWFIGRRTNHTGEKLPSSGCGVPAAAGTDWRRAASGSGAAARQAARLCTCRALTPSPICTQHDKQSRSPQGCASTVLRWGTSTN